MSVSVSVGLWVCGSVGLWVCVLFCVFVCVCVLYGVRSVRYMLKSCYAYCYMCVHIRVRYVSEYFSHTTPAAIDAVSEIHRALAEL